MEIGIGLVIAALKAAVPGAVENEIIAAVLKQGLEMSEKEVQEYCKKMKNTLAATLSDKNLEKLKISKDRRAHIREEIRAWFQKMKLEKELFRKCQYDEKSLADFLYGKYKEQKADIVEYEDDIRKIILDISKKAITLERERAGFEKDALISLMNSQEEIKSKLDQGKDDWDVIRKNIEELARSDQEKELEHSQRMPDRTEEYRQKWTENMFLNDFDADDENAGANIPLWQIHQTPFYRLKGGTQDLSNLEQRLYDCTQEQNVRKRMLLILGQPGMGKSTMITWFIEQYEKRKDEEKKEILVYRFTDLVVVWRLINRGEKKINIDDAILKSLNMKKEDLNGKILILDGFDEVSVGSDRAEILNHLYNEWVLDARIRDFSLLVTCREHYIENLYGLRFPYITLQPWNEKQMEDFCLNYGRLVERQIPETAIKKMQEMKHVFGIPIILYMALALEITVRNDSSVVEVYDQIFSLEGGIYDRCRWDKEHRIAEVKEEIHQFSREISMWMFENNPEQAAIPQKEYEKIWNKIFEGKEDLDESQKKDVLIGNYYKMIRCYDGVGTEQLTFVHRSIYEYFVVETICSEIETEVRKMTENGQEILAGVLGYRLKAGRITQTIGEYLKTKIEILTAAFHKEQKKQFYIWLEGAVGKMLDAGMLYYTKKNISEYKNVMEKELNCFWNILEVLRLFLDFSDREYILHDIDQKQIVKYIRCLTNFTKTDSGGIDLNLFNLEKIVFRKIDLSRIDLRKADLGGINLKGANLSQANLERSDLDGANLRAADLDGANLSRTEMRKTDLKFAELKGADLSGADLIETDLRDANLNGAVLKSTDFSGANLSGTDLTGINLSESILRIANLSRTDLKCADLKYTDFSESDFSDADLSGTDLTKANLPKANLSGADLTGANLSQTNLRKANLRGACLVGANLTNANLDESRWNQKDIETYKDLIKEAEFQVIYVYSKKTGSWKSLIREEILA